LQHMHTLLSKNNSFPQVHEKDRMTENSVW